MLMYTFVMTERTPKSLDGYRQIPNFIILYDSFQKYLQNPFLASLINKIDNLLVPVSLSIDLRIRLVHRA